MSELTVKYNELTVREFIFLWNTVWSGAPAPKQVELALKNTLFSVSVYDNGEIVAMARMIGDLGLDYYIKDVVVRPEYRKKGIGRLMIGELLKYIKANGIKGTEVFVELSAEPKNMAFYEKLGFDANEEQRLKMMCRVD